MSLKCDICFGEKFSTVAGFYYCDECGTQTQKLQEVDFEVEFNETINKTLTKISIRQNKKEALQITSWEYYNYILLGFVNELLDIGAKDELKLTALQIWAGYLRSIEAAFFSPDKPQNPKLGAVYRKLDAQILYKAKIKRTTRKRRNTTGSSISSRDGSSVTASSSRAVDHQSSLAKKRELKKKRKLLAEAEYDDYLKKQTPESLESLSVNRSNTDSMSELSSRSSASGRKSVTSAADNPVVSIEYSRRARTLLKSVMAKGHLKKHEDNCNLSCHKFLKNSLYKGDVRLDVVGRNSLYVILYLAVNQIDDQIQLADIIRFIREGHLTFYDVAKFFPENILNKSISDSFLGGKGVIPTHETIRKFGAKFVQLVHVELKTPNLSNLCKRYVEDLCLPSTVHKIIDILLLIDPPKMKFVQSKFKGKIPNYEARAMGFVLFALKLLFGLDDRREVEISKSAEKINEKLNDIYADRQRLFVYTEWVKFIEMRKILLAQCHFPTAMQTDSTSTTNAHLFVEYMGKMKQNVQTSAEDIKDKPLITNLQTIFNKLKELHIKERADEDNCPTKTSLLFDSSLTPNKSYLNTLLSTNIDNRNMFIPKYMYTDHESRDLSVFIKPSNLQKYLKSKGIALKINRNKCCQANVQFKNIFLFHSKSVQINANDKYCRFDHNANAEDWQEQFVHNRCQEDEVSLDLDKWQTEHEYVADWVNFNLVNSREDRIGLATAKKYSQNNNCSPPDAMVVDDKFSPQLFSTQFSANDDLLILNQPRRDLDEHVELFNCLSSDDESENNLETLPLEMSNFEYWLNIGRLCQMTEDQFKAIRQKFPKSFQWLLKHCATVIENDERQLYNELIVIENYFAYCMEPVNKITNMLLYQDSSKHTKSNPPLAKLIPYLKSLW